MTHTFDSPTDLELAHYGVKGMRWGVRKDRVSGAYANASEKSATRSRKKAGKYESASNAFGNTSQGRRHAKRATKYNNKAAVSEADAKAWREKQAKQQETSRNPKKSSGAAKKALVTAGAIVGVVGAAYVLTKSGDTKLQKIKGSQAASSGSLQTKKRTANPRLVEITDAINSYDRSKRNAEIIKAHDDLYGRRLERAGLSNHPFLTLPSSKKEDHGYVHPNYPSPKKLPPANIKNPALAKIIRDLDSKRG